MLHAVRAELETVALEPDAGPADFRLGLVGWFEYGLRAETLGIPLDLADTPARLLRVDRMLVVDAESGLGELVALGDEWAGELAEWRDAVVARLTGFTEITPRQAAPGRVDDHQDRPPAGVAFLDEDASYAREIRACQRAIADGEAYQLCLTTRVELPGMQPDPVDLLLRLRALSPAHHGGILRIGDTTLVSSSPERFLTVDREGHVSTSPIKGTRRRGDSTAEDERLRSELLASEKEQAENLMIVDLMRNDLSRVCEPGSVEVTSLLAVESYAQVHQLVSTVEGRLSAGRDVVDLLASAFPAGSMTGAPKRRAAQLLAEIEGRERGAYSGAYGWLGFDGAADLAMVIRSVVIDPQGASIGTGGGITALSVPEEEVAEMHLKAEALLGALGV